MCGTTFRRRWNLRRTTDRGRPVQAPARMPPWGPAGQGLPNLPRGDTSLVSAPGRRSLLTRETNPITDPRQAIVRPNPSGEMKTDIRLHHATAMVVGFSMPIGPCREYKFVGGHPALCCRINLHNLEENMGQKVRKEYFGQVHPMEYYDGPPVSAADHAEFCRLLAISGNDEQRAKAA